jgi:hypothetical protein
MPFVSSLAATTGYGRMPTSQAATGVPYTQINTIATYLRNYMAEFRNPSFYSYWLDGSGFFINDCGSDMYDNGNVTSVVVRSGTTYVGAGGYSAAAYPFAVNYTNTTSTVLDTDFYYASLGYIQYVAPTQTNTWHPLTVIGSRAADDQPTGFQVGGNSGADGGGTLSSGTLYSGTVLNGFTVHAFYRETYNAGDPSHCNLFMLLGHPNWGSSFGTVQTFADPVSGGGCGGYLRSTGAGTRNLLAIQTLLSKSGGVLVTAAECQTVVQAFTLRVKEALGFP